MRKNINVLVEDAKAILDDLDIKYGPISEVKVSSRMTRTFGTCQYNKRTGVYRIKISSRLMVEDVPYEIALDTMVHELLHAYKNRMCHTGEWKACANKVNANYPQIHIQRCASEEESKAVDAITAKYKIVCKDCGTACYYTRKSRIVRLFIKHPTNKWCSCGKCHSSNLQMIQL